MENNNKGVKFGDWVDMVDAWEHFDKYEAEFDEFWREVEAYAQEHRLTTRYVEEEFIVDGEFIPVHLSYDLEEEEPSEDV